MEKLNMAYKAMSYHLTSGTKIPCSKMSLSMEIQPGGFMKFRLLTCLFAILLCSDIAWGFELPFSFDLRNIDGLSYIGPVREQGACGSCYSFAALAASSWPRPGYISYAPGRRPRGECTGTDFQCRYRFPARWPGRNRH